MSEDMSGRLFEARLTSQPFEFSRRRPQQLYPPIDTGATGGMLIGATGGRLTGGRWGGVNVTGGTVTGVTGGMLTGATGGILIGVR